MTLNLNVPLSESQLTPKITVIGVGGAGGNAVNNMIQANLEGVDFLVANTDAQAIAQSLCNRTIQIGRQITQGLGAGAQPDVGRAAAEEAMDEILTSLEGVNMVFIAAGMGGGTGTGAAPVIARATREAGILTVGVCTKPFQFEGTHRMQIAESGLSELQQYVDTLIIIPNQNLFRVANEKTTFADAFKMADDVLHAGVRGVTDLIVMPGLINLDFADIRSVMSEMGKAMMGTGEAEGEQRAILAAEAAISNPLLDEVSMKGARGVLINITGGDDLTLFEVDEAANRIRDEVDPEANIIFGSTFEQGLSGAMRVSVVATGIDAEEGVQPRPVNLSLVSDRNRAARGGEVRQAAEASAMAGAAAAAEERYAPPPAEAEPEMEDEEELLLQPEPELAVEALQDDADVFIAPPPVEAEPPVRPRRAAAAAQHGGAHAGGADPYAEAASTGQRRMPAEPAQPELPSRRKAQGLLAKVTGAARAFHDATQMPGQPGQVPPAAPAESIARPARPASPRPAAAEPRPTARAPESAPAAPAAGQSRLTGLDPSERVGVSPSEEDILDIPAFLRRQAN